MYDNCLARNLKCIEKSAEVSELLIFEDALIKSNVFSVDLYQENSERQYSYLTFTES